MKGTKFPLIFLVSIGFVHLVEAQVQNAQLCEDFSDAVWALMIVPDRSDAVMAASVVQTAKAARECYNDLGAGSVEKITWLMNKEVWGLNEQGQKDEAEALVELFYDQYFDESDDLRRATMGMWRMRFRLMKGDISGGEAAYDQTLPYSESLTLAQQTHVRLDAAYIYAQKDSFNAALFIVERVTSDLSRPEVQNPTLRQAHGRALVRAGEMIAELARNGDAGMQARLDSAAILVEKAVGLFRQDQAFGRLCYGLTTLGMIHTTSGNISLGLRYFSEAIETAKEHGISRHEISARRERGRSQAYLQAYKEAEGDFTEALRLSEETDTREFELRLLVELAGAQESQGRMKAARASYNRALDNAGTSTFYEAKRARSAASEGIARTTGEIDRRNLWILLLSVILLFTPGATALWYAQRRRRTSALRSQPNPSFITGPPLFQRRLDYIRRVLYEPIEVATSIQDPILAKRLRDGGVQLNTHIFACAAALEELDDQKTFENRPSNTYTKYLKPRFKKNWPLGVEGWKAFFERR